MADVVVGAGTVGASVVSLLGPITAAIFIADVAGGASGLLAIKNNMDKMTDKQVAPELEVAESVLGLASGVVGLGKAVMKLDKVQAVIKGTETINQSRNSIINAQKMIEESKINE